MTPPLPQDRQGDHANPQPTQDELVDQLQRSDDNKTGPDETLRNNIEKFSRYSPVYKTVAATILRATVSPALVAFIAYQLSPSEEVTSLAGSISRGLWILCPPLFACMVLARALHSDGLAERCFGWSAELCRGLYCLVNTIVFGWLPLRFVYTSLETFDGLPLIPQPTPGVWSDSLGRLLFVASMVIFTIGLRATSKILQHWSASQAISKNWLHDVRQLSYRCLPLIPICLGILSVTGFQFTAIQMSWRMLWTAIFIIGISIVGGFLSHLMLIAQFRIKLRQLSRDEQGEINSGESIDITEISTQVNRLLRATATVAMILVGWHFFADVLPIIDYLDHWQLPWASTDAEGVEESVTLRHALIAFGLAIITLILSRNLPGLLEITLLDRLPLDRGGRYAISFILRYFVGVVGLITACQIIGFNWSSVQWLAAGLTVGLGFGLQEIFSNVISGIIILIERPIRLGDVVTVNGVTGSVTRIQLRATTIKDFDFRELIVPNKRFITDDIMNWTLTDRRSRIVLKVGVAYGSDTQLVHDTLLTVARRHPLVQTEPSPDVFFKEFGDSTLNFDLRVFIPSRDIFARVQHELNVAIEAEFRRKEIEIAFPQQEVYIKNLTDSGVRDQDDRKSA